jgi:hypothetical protein
MERGKDSNQQRTFTNLGKEKVSEKKAVSVPLRIQMRNKRHQ